MSQTQKEKLYILWTELGDSGRLLTILEKFYKKMSEDILIGFFFDGRDLKHIAFQQGQFMLRAMGVTSEYIGKAPAMAHLELPPILQGHFDRRRVMLIEILNEFKLTEEAKKIWLEFESLFRDVVVSRK